MTLDQALAQAQIQGLPRMDAQRLLLQALQRAPGERAWLLAHGDEALSPAQQDAWLALCGQRLAGVPLAYLSGSQAFHGLELQVTPDVLIPRPDTETLVDWALECLQGLPAPRVLDLGTGSGAIALALKARRPDAQLSAIDASAAALAVARANGQRLGLVIDWRQGDWFAPVTGERFDLLLSNPPYIAEGDPHLPDLRHEPLSALISGPDGLSDLRRLCVAAGNHLVPGGWLLLEHGWDQAPAVCALLAAAGLQAVQTRKDLAGIGRCSGARTGSVK